MKLPLYQLKRRAAREREQLAAWLAERDLERLLGEASTPREALPMTGLRYVRTPRAADRVREGDVVLLRPDSAGAWGPVYAVLLDVASENHWRAIPFGRYATPAVPGEWQTPLVATPLRVLCFWNARGVARSQFLPGPVKRCAPKQLDQIRRIDRHVNERAPLEPREAKRLGPPLIHPADPRYAYLEEERERLDAHLHVAASTSVAPDTIITFDFRAREKSLWLLAAEGRPTYGRGRSVD